LAPTEWRNAEVGEMVLAYRNRTRCGCGRDAEVASFYSRVLRRSNVGLRKEGEREVTARAQWQSERGLAQCRVQ
jgi:hypothetical protein